MNKKKLGTILHHFFSNRTSFLTEFVKMIIVLDLEELSKNTKKVSPK